MAFTTEGPEADRKGLCTLRIVFNILQKQRSGQKKMQNRLKICFSSTWYPVSFVAIYQD